MSTIYLDYAAATPLDSTVFAAMEPLLKHHYYNPSSIYLAARAVRKTIETARADVSQIIGCRPAEVIFTAGATEANNIAISGVLGTDPTAHVVVSAVEHDSVLKTVHRFNHDLAPVTKQGLVDVKKLADLIRDNTVLISCMYVNNEVGSVQPIKEIAVLVAKIRKARQASGNQTPLYLHTDAAQAAQLFDIDVSRLGIDLMTLSAGKIYGPKMSGALYVRGGVELQPLIHGGGQEKGIRSGTSSAPAIVGMARALQLVQGRRKQAHVQISQRRQQMVELLKKELPAIVVNGHPKYSSAHILNITLPQLDGERLVMMLDERGIQAATGSACSALDDESSHVLKAMGYNEAEARSSLRLSFGWQTTNQDIETAAAQIIDCVSQLTT